MYIFKNAYVSITRNKGRNILIGIIIMVIAASCAITLAIMNSANALIESYTDQYEIVATIGTDRKNMMQGFDPKSGGDIDDMRETFNNLDSFTLDDISNYANSSYVESYYYTNSINLNSSNISPATSTQTSNNRPKMNNPISSSSDFTLTGYSSLDAMSEFISGSYTIESGEVTTDLYSCIINSELATLNELSVGDSIKLVDPNDSSNKVTLTIAGIYNDNEESTDDRMSMFTNSVNNIIVSSETINEIVNDMDLNMVINPSFIINDKDSIILFEEELHEKGLSEYMNISTNLDQIESSTKAVSNVKTYAITFLIITLIIGAIVLFVINMINVRERKYEIGVLRTIGMKKSTLTMQFIIELLIVSCISLIIGSGIGASMSVNTANNLLKNEIESSNQQQENIAGNFGNRFEGNDKFNLEKVNGITNVSAFSSIDAVVDIKVLFELLGIGLLLTLISSLSSMISIQRFSPLTILKERG